MERGDGMPQQAEGQVQPLGALEILEFGGQNRRRLLIGGIAGGLLFGLVSFLSPATFTSSAVIAPDAQGLAGGQLAGFAAQLGVAFPSGAGVVPPALFVAMLRSDQLLLSVASTRYPAIADSTLSDREKESLFSFLATRDATPAELTKAASNRLRDHLHVTSDPETGSVELDIGATSPTLANEIAERALDVLDSLSIVSKQRQGAFEREFFDSRLRESEDSLKAASTRMATFLAQNRAIQGSPWLQFQFDQLQRAVNGEQALQQSLRQSYEQARLDAVRSVPAFLIIQTPDLPIKRDSRHTIIRGMIGGIFGLFVMATWLLVIAWWRGVVSAQPARAELIRRLYSRSGSREEAR